MTLTGTIIAAIIILILTAFFARWLFRFILGYFIAFLCNLINIIKIAIRVLIGKEFYIYDIITNAFSIGVDTFIILFVSYFCSSKPRARVVTSSLLCFIIASYNLYKNRMFAIFPFGVDGSLPIDWVSTSICFTVMLMVSCLFCLIAGNED